MNNPFGPPPPPVHVRGQWEYSYMGIPNYPQQAVPASNQQAPPPQQALNAMANQYRPQLENPYAAKYPQPGSSSSGTAPNYISSSITQADSTPSVRSHHRPAPSTPPSIVSWLSTTSRASLDSTCTIWPDTRPEIPQVTNSPVAIDINLPGHRHETDLPRGVYVSSGAGGVEWQLAIENIVQYKFSAAGKDLLEEALESPNSGVTCVGESHRHLGRCGNKGLAGVGQMAMDLVLMDQAYGKKNSDGEALKQIERLTHRKNLDRIGKQSKIERFVRRRQSTVTKNTQVFRMLKEDAQFEDPSRTIARAMKAIIGAVYYDGGLDGVKKVMAELGLEII